MSILKKLFNVFTKKATIKDVYNKFLNGDKKNVFAVMYKNNLLGLIEHAENLNKKWFESQLITIKCESGYFLSISLPNSLSHNLAFHSGFSVKKFIKRNNFIVIEKTTEFTGLGRFYSDDIDEKKILSDLVNFFHDIYIIDNEKFHFEIMSTNKT